MDKLTDPRALIDRTYTEAEWQSQVEELLDSLGWHHFHSGDSRRDSRSGYPDLTCWRERVIFVELKLERRYCTKAQATTLLQLDEAGAEVYVWRPSDWETAKAVLA